MICLRPSAAAAAAEPGAGTPSPVAVGAWAAGPLAAAAGEAAMAIELAPLPRIEGLVYPLWWQRVLADTLLILS